MKDKFPKVNDVLFKDKELHKNILSSITGGKKSASEFTVSGGVTCGGGERTQFDPDTDI